MSRHLRPYFLLVLFLVLCAGGRAQTPTVPPSGVQNPRALAVLSSCYRAMGSPDKDFSLVIQGSIVDTDHKDPMVRDLTVEDRGQFQERWEERSPKGAQTIVVSGQRGRLTRGGRNVPLPVSNTTFRVSEFVPGFACRIGRERQGLDVQYIGAETVNGEPIDHVEIGLLSAKPQDHDHWINAALVSLDIYVSQSTHLVTAIRKNVFDYDSDDNHLPIEFQYSSYQSVSGVEVPTSITHILNGKEIEAVTVTSATQGGSIADADFQ